MITLLSAVAAIGTASAIVMFLLMRSAQRAKGALMDQIRVANDTAESAVRTTKRMQKALQVVAEEIKEARAEREASDEVIALAEKVIENTAEPAQLQDAWNKLLKKGRR